MIVLIHPEQDRGASERELDLPQHLSSWTHTPRRPPPLLRAPPDAVVSEPDPTAGRRSPRRSPPGTRPGANSSSTGHEIDECRHRLHRVEDRPRRASNPSCARRDPDGIAITTAISTATSTWLSVSIASSHMPSRPMPKMHRNEKTARRHPTPSSDRPRRRPATIHHGTPRAGPAADRAASADMNREIQSAEVTARGCRATTPPSRSPARDRGRPCLSANPAA